MKRQLVRLSVVGLMLCFVGTASAQLLYKISGNGLTKPSYLFGTHHFADGEFSKSVNYLHRIMKEAEQFCGELDLEEVARVEKLYNEHIIKYSALPNNQTMDDILTRSELARLNKITKELLGYSYKEMPAEKYDVVSRVVPIVYTMMVSIWKPSEKSNQSGKTNNPIDIYLLRYAKESGKRVLKFECVEDQLDIIFPFQMPLKQQKKYMFHALENQDIASELQESIAKAYRVQDVETIKGVILNKRLSIINAYSKENMKRLFDERNTAWAERMPAMMGEKSTLFFVGVGHLLGQKGLLNLLRKKGYTVEPMM